MLVSVVFSFWNEELVLEELIGRVVSSLEGTDCNYELVFVNDNSTDRSLDILNTERLKNNKLKIMS